MKQHYFLKWVTLAGVIGIVFGVFYAIFGLDGLPVYQKIVAKDAFAGWSHGLYGAVFVGFSVILLLLGRRAIQKKDKELANILLSGIVAWLVVEATFSVIYKVYLNVLVDVFLVTFLSYPLLKGTRK